MAFKSIHDDFTPHTAKKLRYFAHFLKMAACIATWIFGLPAVKSAKIKLLSGDTALNAVEKSVNDVEEDLSSGAYLVGRGGRPNDEGVLECDAAIMDGQGSRFGAVAALQGVS